MWVQLCGYVENFQRFPSFKCKCQSLYYIFVLHTFFPTMLHPKSSEINFVKLTRSDILLVFRAVRSILSHVQQTVNYKMMSVTACATYRPYNYKNMTGNYYYGRYEYYNYRVLDRVRQFFSIRVIIDDYADNEIDMFGMRSLLTPFLGIFFVYSHIDTPMLVEPLYTFNSGRRDLFLNFEFDFWQKIGSSQYLGE